MVECPVSRVCLATRSRSSRDTSACARIAPAAAGGISPVSACACASAARMCSHACVRPSSENSAEASGVVHRCPKMAESAGCALLMARRPR